MDNRFYKSAPHRPRPRHRLRPAAPRARAGLALRIRPPPRPVSPVARQDSGSSVRQRPRLGATWLATPLAAFTIAAVAEPAPSGQAVRGRRDGCGERRRHGRRHRAAPRRRAAGAAARRCGAPAADHPARARCAAGPTSTRAAEGDVEFRRGGMVIHADKLTYDQAEDFARATGRVVVTRDGNVFSGPELQLKVERFEGFFRSPSYRFARTDAGGKARLIEFIDDQRAVATDATYSSCTIDDGRRRAGVDPEDGRAADRPRGRRRRRAATRCCASTACRSWPRRCSAFRSAKSASRGSCRRASASTTGAASRPRSPTTGTSRPTATRPSRCRRACAAGRRSTASSATSSRRSSAR